MEIGGYLEFERFLGTEYHTGCLKLNTARNCLKYLIEARNIKKIWISRWNCEAVIKTCIQSGIDINYYDLALDFTPILPESYSKDDYLYVVNYFGQLSAYSGHNIIMDNVQAFFQMPLKGMDTLYTCRKYFGVTDGAYLYTDVALGRELATDESFSRILYLAGRFEKTASAFYEFYKQNEANLDSLPLLKMSHYTENLLKSFDYLRIKEQREINFRFLHDHLGKKNLFKVKLPIGPFSYPFMVHEGKKLRERLQKKNIYIPMLWPNVNGDFERHLAIDILPLPCDQRYSIEDMRFIVNSIKELY